MTAISKVSLRILAAMALSGHLCFAQDWPQWRGPNRDGIVTSFVAPRQWPEKLRTIWKVPVGIGHSSPVVVGRRVYEHSRQDENEVTSCFDLETGKLLWHDSYPTPYSMNPAAASHGKGPKSTPAVANGKLYTFGISGILSCYDAATGRVVWRKEFSKQFKETSPFYGTAASPIVHNGMVIVHVGGTDLGALTAFDAETGAVKWSWTGDGPSYASPILFTSNGTAQIVTQTQKSIAGFSPASGTLLWQIPFETAFVQNIVTPAVYRDTLILSGLNKGTMAVRIVRRGDKLQAEKVWENPDNSMYMNSPVVVGDYVFGLSQKRKGQFFCLDARTGKTMWTTEGREGDNAAIVAAGDLLLMLNEDAQLSVVRRDSAVFQLLKKYTVADSATWAHPVVVGNRMLIKDNTTLTLSSFE